MSTNAEVNDLVLRVHTRLASDNAQKAYRKEHWRKKLGKHHPDTDFALLVDCETTTKQLGQRFNFGFYRKCELIDGIYQTVEEGIIIAQDLETRMGKEAVELLK